LIITTTTNNNNNNTNNKSDNTPSLSTTLSSNSKQRCLTHLLCLGEDSSVFQMDFGQDAIKKKGEFVARNLIHELGGLSKPCGDGNSTSTR